MVVVGEGVKHHDESDVEEQVPMEEGGEHDEAALERAVHSRHDVERVRRHPGVKEMVRVLKHGRASELAIQEARRMHCDICAENVQPKLPRSTIPRQVLEFTCRPGYFEFASPERCIEIGEMFEYRVSWNSVSDDHSTVVGDDDSGCETCVSKRLAVVGT